MLPALDLILTWEVLNILCGTATEGVDDAACMLGESRVLDVIEDQAGVRYHDLACSRAHMCALT